MPFSINRVFWITDVEGKERGKHAHNTCAELLVAAEGSFLVDVRDSDDTEKFQTFSVNAKDNRGLLIPAKTWCRLHDFTPGTVCLCLASENYNADGYIQ